MQTHLLTWGGAFWVFLSGYCPLAILIALLDFNFKAGRLDHPWANGIIMALFALSCIITVIITRSFPRGITESVESVKAQRFDMFSYLVPYFAAFTITDAGDYRQLGALAVLLLVVYCITYKTRKGMLILMNPFLLFLGYQFYAATIVYRTGTREECIIISKGEMEHKNIPVTKIGEGVFVETP